MQESLGRTAPRFSQPQRRAIEALLCASLVLGCRTDAVDLQLADGDATTVSIDRPEHAVPEPFGAILGVREVATGRVLLSDGLGKVLVRINFASGIVDTVNAEGAGPGEYAQPGALLPFRGDSTLMLDFGNGRLTVVGGSGALGRSMPMVQEVNGDRPLLVLPHGADADGRLYIQPVYRSSLGDALPNVAPLIRWDPELGIADTIASLALSEIRPYTGRMPGMSGNPDVPVSLSPVDAWAVFADGRVAVARARPYHIEFVEDDAWVAGPKINWSSYRVEDDEREAWLQRSQRDALHIGTQSHEGASTVTIELPGPGGHGSLATSMNEWAERSPPFYEKGAHAAPDGMLWVERFSPADEPSELDVFDKRGELVLRVRLPIGRKVAAIGLRHVYAIRVDELGQEFLEAYLFTDS